MRKRLLILALLLVVLVFAVACGASEQGSKGIFYEVIGGENQVFLFGSVHLGHEDMYPLDAAVDEAFSKSDVLVLEIDLSSMHEMEIAQQMMTFGMYADGEKMTDFVPSETFEALAEVVAPLGIDTNILANLKPWYAAMILTDVAMADMGLSAEYGVEEYFINKATDMEIIGLETISDQLYPFTKLSNESQVIYLQDALAEMDNTEEELNKLLSHWQEGNIDYFAQMRQEVMEDLSTDSLIEYQKAFLDGRDEKMVEKIMELLEQDSGKIYFIVVGSLHLAGENSIVELLTTMGYEVIPGY